MINPARWTIRNVILAMFAAMFSSVAIGCQRGPGPNLLGLDALLATRQFDAAEKKLADFLAANPENVQAHMLMAQVSLNRDPQKPELALEHLAKVRGGDRSLRALVKLNEGKALSALEDHSKAEEAWREALRIDPTVPEAGWALLSLYYVEGRRRDAERLGLALHAVEPEPRDRAQLLLELVRQDAKPIVPADIVRALEPCVRAHPEDTAAKIGLARGYIRDSRADDAIPLLKEIVEKEPEEERSWESLFYGLVEASRPEDLEQALTKLPSFMREDQRFARYLGILAQNRHDWPAAAIALERARSIDPLDSQLVYRLGRVYRLAGREADAKRVEAEFRDSEAVLRQMLPLYNEANAIRGFGVTPTPDLIRRIAEARERLGYRAEALVWYRLVLRDKPDDPTSLAAVDRLADVKLPDLMDVLAEKADRD